MSLLRIGLSIAVAGLWVAPAFAQTIQGRCLHGESETQAQAQRRLEALDASDVIIRVLNRHPRSARYPTWEALAKGPWVASFRSMAGRSGDVARKMLWGADQPLPGWQIHYVAAPDGYAFSLTDIRDPCRLAFAANDTGVVIEGRPAQSPLPRVIPLDSSQ